jgi:hypothetical protein
MSRTSTEIADLEEAAARFAAAAGPTGTRSTEVLSELVAAAGFQDRTELVADALATGAPNASLDLIDQLAAEIEPRWTLDRRELVPAVYGAALGVRLRRPDLGEIVDGLDQWLAAVEAGDVESQDDGEVELLLQSLGSGLAPLAGLDVAATLHYARVFMDNFPPFSLPLGDVDERATRWLAQLLDMGTIRVTLRRALLDLAAAWQASHPRAAGQLRAWSETPVPSDPTQDLPWMHALLPLARSQM